MVGVGGTTVGEGVNQRHDWWGRGRGQRERQRRSRSSTVASMARDEAMGDDEGGGGGAREVEYV